MSCNLTDAEWKLMHRLWEQSPQTITQLTAALSAETGWEKHTVITMLTRLEAKGAVRHEAGGSLGLMMSAMVEGRALTREDIDELTAILEQAGGNTK